MRTFSRICLIVALLALSAAPAIADGGAITYTDHGEVPDWHVQDWFVCLGENPGDEGEPVDLHIAYAWVAHGTIAPSGAQNTVYMDVNDGAGIGLYTGNAYDSHWVWHYHFTGRVGHVEEFHGTLVWKNLTTGQTQLSPYAVHITVNANGTVVVERIDPWPAEAKCLH
jgi:hypothetical protein